MMENISQIIFSNSPKMNKVKTIIDQVARTDITVLIKGESGTGKDLVAQAIHQLSLRANKPFVKLNCAAIPRGLLESELFGFEKGAFTGANLKKPGRFELANGGTILLNDIGEMELSAQGKLLQVLQDGRFSRLGGNGDVLVDTRVIAATKTHLERAMMEGRFREDLFYRINVISITVPPLREQKEQILPLIQYFFNFYKHKYKKEIPPLSPGGTRVLTEYPWPGNIREVENIIKRVIISGNEEPVIQSLLGHSPPGHSLFEREKNPSPPKKPAEPMFDLKEVGRKAAEEAEKKILQAALHETHWNRREAAQLLQISYKALLYKVEKYHMDKARNNPWKSEKTGKGEM
jgi:two-component system response regulator AtoC